MSNKLIADLNRENLCTYFILPLTGVNKDVFLAGNFLNSYISMDKKSIVVEVIEPLMVSPRVRLHLNYRCTRVCQLSSNIRSSDNSWVFEFSIPTLWKPDLEKFLNGQFSKMSEAAKDVIRTRSGLPYEKEEYRPGIGHTKETDLRLCALDKNNTSLRRFWQDTLDVVLPKDMELLSIPSEETMIELSYYKVYIPYKDGTLY